MQMLSKFAAVWFAISTALALPACKLVTSHSSVKSESKAPETGHVTCPTEGFSDICLSYENGTCAWTRCNYGKESGETEPCNYQNRSNFNSCLVNSTPTCESCGGIAASKFAPTDGVTVVNSKRYDAFINPDDKYSAYAGAETALFLADGAPTTPGKNIFLGPLVSKAHPNLDVIRTDYDINETTVQGKVKSMHLDTAMPFKIPDKSQDIVVMRRGTCYCHENACGGMDIFNQSSITSFMLESARVLRTTKPGNGVFYLNNREGKEQSLTPWVNGAKTVMNLRKDIEVQILVTDFGRFDGIAMVPSKPSKQINGTSAD